jgi:hypothetical protein
MPYPVFCVQRILKSIFINKKTFGLGNIKQHFDKSEFCFKQKSVRLSGFSGYPVKILSGVLPIGNNA